MQWTQGFPWAMTTCVLRTQAHDDLSRAASLERVTDDWDDWDEALPRWNGVAKNEIPKYAAIVLKCIETNLDILIFFYV